jgi:hypothetical protein
VPRKIFGAKRDKVSGERRILQTRNFTSYASHLTLLELLNNAFCDELDTEVRWGH